MLENIVGNTTATAAMKAALYAGRLSHSILISGEAGTGTGFAARCLAADYLYPQNPMLANRIMQGQCEECIEVFGEGASGDIKIERIRQVRKEIFSTALNTVGRVVIIHQAQNFNLSSANALLKVLEEPPQGVLFILTACNAGAVLSTIRSRCVVFSFSPPSVQECVQYLHTHRPAYSNAEFLATVFDGKIGNCLDCIDNPERNALFEQALEIAQLVAQKNIYGLLCRFSAFEKDKPAAKQILNDLQAICAAALENRNQIALSPFDAAKCIPVFQAALRGLDSNLNAKLLFTTMVFELQNGNSSFLALP